MDKAYRIIPDNKTNFPATNMNGWSITEHIAGTLDYIPVGNQVGKMGTSIPSLFSRMELFKIAFDSKKNANFDIPTGAITSLLSTRDADTTLISECLDMLELLYQYGSSDKIEVKLWDSSIEIPRLASSGIIEHRNLKEVLQAEIERTNKSWGYGQSVADHIYLFYWKDYPLGISSPRLTLIGGTSPFTLVFTSPNWKRKARAIGFSQNRLDGSPLFFDSKGNDSFQPLTNRDKTFKYYLYNLLEDFQNANIPRDKFSFLKYVEHSWEKDMKPTIAAHSDVQIGTISIPFVYEIETGQFQTHDIIIKSRDPHPTIQCGYEIIPNTTRWKSAHLTHAPLVLSKGGLPNVQYVNGKPWSTVRFDEVAIKADEEFLNGITDKRHLPGDMGIDYPFIIASDLLEDKIMKLRTEANTNHFHLGKMEDSTYLLPLRRTFFDFFNPEDIDKMVTLTKNSDTVIVNIEVPVTASDGAVINLSRTYTVADTVILNQTDFAFFPFYKIDTTQTVWAGKDGLNQYNVMLRTAQNNDLSFKFYALTPTSQQPVRVAANTKRTSSVAGITTHCHVNEAFDVVELKLNSGANHNLHAVIVPKMTVIANQPTRTVTFAVDFGTSNTHIAFQSDAHTAPQTLTILEADRQTILYAKIDDIGANFINREFSPISIGQSKDIQFPMRTVSCETDNFANSTSPSLFSHISVGFNFQLEESNPQGYKYVTDLKWLLEKRPIDPSDRNRVKFFFTHLLWIMKNKSLLNQGSEQFEVRITFPMAMLVPTRNAIMAVWQDACKELGLDPGIVDGTYKESVTPYNSLAHVIGGESYLNIDIGGGTNDILYVKKNMGTIEAAYYSSARFAAGDLWGDGVKISAAGGGQNGFLMCADAAIGQQIPSNIKARYLQLKNKCSGDAMNYMFNNDSYFNPKTSIQGSPLLYSLVFIHYGAILYNVARLLKKYDLDIPPMMSFTGMGSKYIDIIASDTPSKTALTNLLLTTYTGKETPKGFQILDIKSHTGSKVAADQQINGDVKEVTANGAILGSTLAPNFQIDTSKLSKAIDYGFDTTEPITFGHLKNKEIFEKAYNEFEKYLLTWKQPTVSQYLSTNYDLTISEQLLNSLKLIGRQSLTTMITEKSGLGVADTDELGETLFFYPLKNAIYEISKTYQPPTTNIQK